ncbi:hypothetical protein A2Y83_03665 [Candidatus Falkowbacteria bacterium RBG_13_39_14]|uniref:Antitoxin SocA-like Panacea domain-containing protein n=1 Tax=Candidatus Falkowbacteria bacterium RBG_13_39_14 TaxID=1797985 RepID=A0A1F5S1R8_9BACT|nr:MAG: hypothetical protein A2Y83_03665 [Candidatus Falkowbacteria bacterium RBG_13_39_14]
MALNKTKYEEAIIYLCWKLGKEIRGKKKLAKLLYYIDFDYYEKYQKFFTGEIYKKLPMGPFPFSLEAITDDLAKRGVISIEKLEEWDGYNPTEIYKVLRNPNVAEFSEEEKEMLDRVIAKYGRLNGKELENLTHAEAPYIGAEDKKEIPYELVFYRGTEF